jgi:hypothetical protein
MAPTADGVEMIMSVRRDERFGWIVMAGLGGIYAEVFDDVAVRLARTVSGRDDLDEVEVNPILVLRHSVLALDARIVRRAGSLTLVDDGGPDDPRGTEHMWTRP